MAIINGNGEKAECGDCMFFAQTNPNHAPHPAPWGDCRANPPTKDDFPYVAGDSWCGCYKDRQD